MTAGKVMTDTLNAQPTTISSAWHGFTGTGWTERIDVAASSARNFTPYRGEVRSWRRRPIGPFGCGGRYPHGEKSFIATSPGFES